ncbi:hypothetical protein HanIR_Chr12g0566041 [Helianthus annuus]|nr:hypothetical protein HanIR_Chr12g0566041 [Helianthus annuus]
MYLKWPLLDIDASGFGVPFLAASCCSRAFDSKYSSHAAASYNISYISYLVKPDFYLCRVLRRQHSC